MLHQQGYLTLSGDEWEHERPRREQTEKSPPSRSGWSRAGRNVPIRAGRSPIGKACAGTVRRCRYAPL